MEGRVLRSSNGRFAGSTKGWRKGKAVPGRTLQGQTVGKRVARTSNNPVGIARATARRATITATKAGAKYVAKSALRSAVKGAAIYAGGSLLFSAATGRGFGSAASRAAKSAMHGAAVGGAAGAIVGMASVGRVMRSSAAASASLGLSNRAAAKIRQVSPTTTRSQSYKTVARAQKSSRNLTRTLKRAQAGTRL